MIIIATEYSAKGQEGVTHTLEPYPEGAAGGMLHLLSPCVLDSTPRRFCAPPGGWIEIHIVGDDMPRLRNAEWVW